MSRIPLVLFIAFLCSSGCTPEVPFPELHPLSGTVIRLGKPVDGGGIGFLREVSDPSGLTFSAHVNADGTFEAETMKSVPSGTVKKTGIRPGRYRVVYHPQSDGSKLGQEVRLDVVIEVKPGNNSITLTLPDEMPKPVGLPRSFEKGD
ncbi:MAG: hypothetical protein ACRC8S_04180 [Fimbriiglobus sp.]